MTKFNIHHNENVTVHNESHKTVHKIEPSNTEHNTRLELFTAISQNNLDVIRKCAFKLSTVDYPDSKGTTALLFAVALNKLEAVKLLCELGADPDVLDHTGRVSALTLSQNLGRTEITLCLIQTKEKRAANQLHTIISGTPL